jgi:hypothetical protein
MSPIYVPGKVVFAQVSQPLDTDAQAYVNAVEVADGQRIEDPVRFAINNFVIGCKADGIWTAIKASCILAGARTLTGALVPLVGTAPTNVSFVSGDYNRKTGLVGDGSTKYLDSNRNNNADPQNSFHATVYVHTAGTPSSSTQVYLGTFPLPTTTGSTTIAIASDLVAYRSRHDSADTGFTSTATGLIGMSRALSTSYLARANGSNLTFTRTSQSRGSQNIFIWRDASTTFPFYSNARLAFYSIGESLDLALLDSRVTTLINAFAAAIP